MADHSDIEWTDATWNPITGCSVLSPGCKRCYAMKLAGTRLRNHPSRKGLTIETKAGPVWTGEVRFNEGWLDQPLRWRRGRRIFVCAHADLFHEDVPDEWIDRIFAVMAASPQHEFQVLTKRSKRMASYSEDALGRVSAGSRGDWPGWPLPNVVFGVSAEDQERADERLPDLAETVAAKRFVSLEPLLEPIVMKPEWLAALNLVIVGGESATTNPRPMPPEAVRSLRDQCAIAGVPFMFKQWGSWAPVGVKNSLAHIWPDGSWSHNIGKKSAGRLLDGIEHNGIAS